MSLERATKEGESPVFEKELFFMESFSSRAEPVKLCLNPGALNFQD